MNFGFSINFGCSPQLHLFRRIENISQPSSEIVSIDSDAQVAASYCFNTEDVRNCIVEKIKLTKLIVIGVVSKDYYNIYKKALIAKLNSGTSLREIKIKSFIKFIDFLGQDTSLLKTLNLSSYENIEGKDKQIDSEWSRNIIERLTNLTRLSMSGCDIHNVDTNLENLSRLNLLDLNLSNCIDRLGYSDLSRSIRLLPWIENLTSLTSLDLSRLPSANCRIPQMGTPCALRKLTNLENLNLASTGMALDSLQYLTKLKELNLEGIQDNVNLQPFKEFFKGHKWTCKNGDVFECQIVNGKAEGQIVNGEAEGFVIKRNSKGVKKFEGYVVAGIPTGPGTSFYDNGKIEFVGNFREGIRHGLGTLFDLNGKKIHEGNFLKNEPFVDIAP